LQPADTTCCQQAANQVVSSKPPYHTLAHHTQPYLDRMGAHWTCQQHGKALNPMPATTNSWSITGPVSLARTAEPQASGASFTAAVLHKGAESHTGQ